MATIGSKLGLSGRPGLAEGQQIDPKSVPQPVSIPYASFVGGLDLSDAPEGLELDRATLALDMEVTRDDKLVRSPGLTLIEDATPHSLLHIFPQASIDYSTELLALDPPYIGVKGAGSFVWTNVGLLAADRWAGANVIGTMIFSDGVSQTYTRDFGAAVVTDVSAEIIAQCFGTAFGRVFAGGFIGGSGYQALGIAWNAASGAIGDWSGLGSGNEFLLNDTRHADKIVAIRPIGFDVLGILCRYSLWIGEFTRDDDRPADFRQRFDGIGCVSEKSVDATPGGVTFLSDEGVANFSPNGANIISGSINAELLPLDYTQLDKYVGTYQAVLRRYVLATPQCTWIYEFQIVSDDGKLIRPARWFKRQAIVDNVLSFANQTTSPSWEDMAGTWDVQVGTWDDLASRQVNSPLQVYATKGTKLGVEDQNATTNLDGTVVAPLWRTAFSSKISQTDILTTVGFEIEYVSYENAQVRISTPDTNGDFTNVVVKTLPSSNGKYARYMIYNVSTGMGAAAQIEFLSGSPKVAHLRQLIQPTGPGLATL